VRVGAASQVSWEGTHYLVPWFVITKKEGEKTKNRLISDCRGSLERHLSPVGKGDVGDKSGSKEGLFPLGTFPGHKTVHQDGDGPENFSNGRCLFRSKHPPLPVDTGNESLSQKVEKKGSPGFCLLGRHIVVGEVNTIGKKTHSNLLEDQKQRYDGQPKEKSDKTKSAGGTPGFILGSKQGCASSTHPKVENNQAGASVGGGH